MGRFERLFDRLAGPAFSRDAEPAPRALIGMPADGGLTFGGVTAATLAGMSAVFRSLDILSNGVSQLEWLERRGNLELPPSRIVSRPQAQRTRREWTSLSVATMALFDCTYLLQAGGLDSEGVPISLLYLDPTLVMPTDYDYARLLPPDEYWIGGARVPADQLVILRRGPLPTIPDHLAGVLNLARVQFAASLAADRYASRYWQAGGSPQTVLETDATMDDPTANGISDRWALRRMKGPDWAPVLSGGLKARDFGADPTAASAVEARKEMVADVGRYFGIPTQLLNAPAGDSETYNTTELQGIGLVTYTLMNYIRAIEDGISDLLPGGRYMQMETASLTRGTQLSRAQSWELALGGANGTGAAWMDVDEVREAEGLPPRELPARTPALSVIPGGVPNGQG